MKPKLTVHSEPVYWTSPLKGCDLCGRPFGKVMYDAKTKGGPPGHGAWGNLDQKCFERHGVGLGLGLGQKYERQADGRWLKTEG